MLHGTLHVEKLDRPNTLFKKNLKGKERSEEKKLHHKTEYNC